MSSNRNWTDRFRTPAEAVGESARETIRLGWNARWTRFVRMVVLLLPRYANHRGPRADALFLALAAIVGVLGAFGVQLFFNMIDLANEFLVQRPMRLEVLSGRWIVVPLLTGSSLAVAAWIMRRFGNGYDGLNVPDVSHAVEHHGGAFPPGCHSGSRWPAPRPSAAAGPRDPRVPWPCWAPRWRPSSRARCGCAPSGFAFSWARGRRQRFPRRSARRSPARSSHWRRSSGPRQRPPSPRSWSRAWWPTRRRWPSSARTRRSRMR